MSALGIENPRLRKQAYENLFQSNISEIFLLPSWLMWQRETDLMLVNLSCRMLSFPAAGVVYEVVIREWHAHPLDYFVRDGTVGSN